MSLPAEYKDAAARICISAAWQFGLFQFAARGKVSAIQCLTLPSCLPGSSKPVCSRTLAIIFQKKKKREREISSASDGTSLGRLESRSGFPLSWGVEGGGGTTNGYQA